MGTDTKKASNIKERERANFLFHDQRKLYTFQALSLCTDNANNVHWIILYFIYICWVTHFNSFNLAHKMDFTWQFNWIQKGRIINFNEKSVNISLKWQIIGVCCFSNDHSSLKKKKVYPKHQQKIFHLFGWPLQLNWIRFICMTLFNGKQSFFHFIWLRDIATKKQSNIATKSDGERVRGSDRMHQWNNDAGCALCSNFRNSIGFCMQSAFWSVCSRISKNQINILRAFNY